jgi:hypothetical protein
MTEVNLEHGFIVERNADGNVKRAIRASTVVGIQREDTLSSGRTNYGCRIATIGGATYPLAADTDFIYGLLNPTFAGV